MGISRRNSASSVESGPRSDVTSDNDIHLSPTYLTRICSIVTVILWSEFSGETVSGDETGLKSETGSVEFLLLSERLDCVLNW